MGTPWHVWKDDDQRFVVDDLKQLRTLAQQGSIKAYDLVQPDGASDWLYASEVPSIGDIQVADEVSTFGAPKKTSPFKSILGFCAAVGALYFGYQGYTTWLEIPSESDLQIIGESGLKPDEALTTGTARVLSSPDGSSLGTLEANTKVQLIEKQKELFKVETPKGTGWISMYDLAPAYLMADQVIRDQYDSRFNTYRKIEVRNPSWERAERGSDITNLTLSLQNLSPFPVEDIVIRISLSDASGNSIKKEVAVTGTIKESDTDKIGTLRGQDGEPDRILTRSELRKMKKKDADVVDRWVEIIEFPLGNQKFTQPSIEIKIDDARPILPEE